MDEETPLQQNQTALRRPVRALPQQEEEKRERIKIWMAVMMSVVVLLIDAVEAVLAFLLIGLFINPIISAISYFGFWVWFKILGVEFIKNPKKFFTMLGGAIAEIAPIPFLSALPALSASVIAVIFMTMAEDKGGIIGKAASVAQGKIK